MLDKLTDWAIRVVEQLGSLGVAMLVAIENVFPPIPCRCIPLIRSLISIPAESSIGRIEDQKISHSSAAAGASDSVRS